MERGNIIGLYVMLRRRDFCSSPAENSNYRGAPVETVHQTNSRSMAHLAEAPRSQRP